MIGGAVVGFFNPALGVALGASIGGAIGGLLDPPKGPNVIGPRLDDLSIQTSTYGAAIGRAYGTVSVVGNIFWLEGDQLKETTTTEEQGGKGGGGQQVTTYSYSATFAVGLLQVTDPTQTVALRRLWIGTDLVYDAGSDNLESIIASNSQTTGFTFYNGADDQLPNPRMQADKGAANVSAYPGLCYIVFEDLALEKYGNTLQLAQVEAELVVGSVVVDSDLIHTATEITFETGMGASLINPVFLPNGIVYSTIPYNSYTQRLLEWKRTTIVFGESQSTVDVASFSGINLTPYGWAPSPNWVNMNQCDSDIMAGVQLGTWGDAVRILWLYPSGDFLSSTTYTTAEFPSDSYIGAHEGNSTYFANPNTASKIRRAWVGIDDSLITTAANYRIISLGLSENFLFATNHTGAGTTVTVYRFNKSDLSLDATYSAACGDWKAHIHVVSDDHFYTFTNRHVFEWTGGVMVADLGGEWAPRDDYIFPFWFRVFNGSPQFGAYCRFDTDSYPYTFGISHALVDNASASLRDIVTAECGLAGIEPADLDLTDLTDSDVRGYRISNAGAIRAALEPLQAAFPFDVAQSGYSIRFVSRGGASVATIPEEDLGAAAPGDNAQVLLPVAREMDSQIARRVNVKYLDPDREYDLGEQFAERPGTASVGERTVELALVLTGTEAAQIADILLSKEWVERREFGPFFLPPTWRHLEPADVVAVEHRGQSYTLRLTRVEYLPDGRLQCQAKQTAAACYTSTATGEDPIFVGQSLVPLKGSTTGYLLDIPRIRAEQDVPGMSFALLGRASGWPGAALLRSDDSGNTWPVVGAMNNRARVFEAGAALSAHHGYSPDYSSALTVTPVTPDAELYSVTEEQFYSESNLAAYGADGRWEIVSFKTAVDNTGTFTLRDFLRGLYGSEWASGLHETGDLLIMLDTATVGFFGLPINALGSPRLYKAVTQGATIDSATSVTDTYDGNNIKPLSLVDLNGHRNPTTLDWAIKPTRRTRWPVELFSGQTVPLGESIESYSLDIYDSGYATLKRTLTSSNGEFAYTAAQQIADHGSEPSTLYVDVFQGSSVIGRGYPLRASIYRYLPLDPYSSFNVLLMRMDSSGFPDVMGNTITNNGSVSLVADTGAYGGQCASFLGSNWLRAPDNSSFTIAGDFIIEARIYLPSVSSGQCVCAHWKSGGATQCAFNFGVEAGGKLFFGYGIGGSNVQINGTSATVPTNQFVNIACWRNGTEVRFAVGTTVDSTVGTVSGALNNCPDGFSVGVSGGDSSPVYYFGNNAKIDQLRFTNGSCRGFSTTYTPPAGAYPDP
jgi:hypothetical protein